MVSRLDRLFILLDTGSNESIRLAAAKQLGEVQRAQPDDLGYLLERIKEFSCKPGWETRTAAGHALRCVLENVPPWPHLFVKQERDFDSAGSNKLEPTQAALQEHFDIERILIDFDLEELVATCPVLVSADSSMNEICEASTSSKQSKARGRRASMPARKQNKDQLQRQRQLINKELGIAMVDSLGMGVKSTDIISNDDLQEEYPLESCDLASKAKDGIQRLRDKTNYYMKTLQQLHKTNCLANSSQSDSQTSIPNTNRWPLSVIAEQYQEGLFNPSWETRHGCAISLREIVKSQGKCAGKLAHLSNDINDKLNELWLSDMALKALCVLSLDRFGDFLFDQVVAPVRENTAQLLGCCVALLQEKHASCVINILVKMLSSPKWEIRHGGMLGLKYSLSALDNESMKKTIPRTFNPIFKCLADQNDDVSAEAAAALVPVKDLLLQTIPGEAPKLIKFLWEHLADLDELTSSTSNIILLLASLITSDSTQLDATELNKSIPKLWPLLNHPSTKVRVSVLEALVTLTRLQARPCVSWMPEEIISMALRLLFQRSIVESMDEVRDRIKDAWLELIKIGSIETESREAQANLLRCTSQYLNYWLCLTMQPSSTPIDRGYCLWLNIRPDGTISDTKPDGEIYIGSSTFNAETMELQKTQIIRCRLLGTYLLGALYSNLTLPANGVCEHIKETLKYLSDMFVHYLSTKSANHRMISGWALESWARHVSETCDRKMLSSILPEATIQQLKLAICEAKLCYDELAGTFTRIQQEARDLVAGLTAANIFKDFPTATGGRVMYNLSQIQSLCDLNIEAELTRALSKKLDTTKGTEHDIRNGSQYSALMGRKQTLSKSFEEAMAAHRSLTVSALSSLASALIAWNIIPPKVRLLIDPLLDSIEKENEPQIHDNTIHYLTELLDILCCQPVENQDTIQLITNRLIDVLHSSSIALISEQTSANSNFIPGSEDKEVLNEHKIILLDNLQRKAEQLRTASRRQSSVSSTAGLKRSHSQASTSEDTEVELNDPKQMSDVRMKMKGVSKALGAIVRHFGADLAKKLPHLWDVISRNTKQKIELFHSIADEAERQTCCSGLIRDLVTLQIVSESMDTSLRTHLSELLSHLVLVLDSPDPMMRHQVGQCIGSICKIMPKPTEIVVRNKIIPMLDSSDIASRCGAIETIALIIEHGHLDMIPMMNMFIVHMLRRMSDQNDQVRLTATHCFGRLLSLVPLNSQENSENDPDPSRKPRSDHPDFIEQLLDPKKLKNFELPFDPKVKLRSYQQDGLNWLAFLNRFNLHGILCDEMGLGKTFMTICMVTADFISGAPPNRIKENSPSLIVCPPTLIEHWLCEIKKFVPSETLSALNPSSYGGNANDRHLIRQLLVSEPKDEIDKSSSGNKTINLLVTSYDVIRNDIDFFRQMHWNYCVLDEGHIIKNGKTKLSRAIRLLAAHHRLILSGTPIQNNVTELWSLFDFLMPGFLGSERQFNSRYARPILQSREPKSSPKELEAGALAMESLHRQVLPFILRRLKEDVLDDLPPKILQDYYCELSPLQSRLYEDFTRSKLCNEVTKNSLHQLSEGEDLNSESKINPKSHVFQALNYLKSVCNHPKLVLTPKHSQYNEIKKYLDSEKTSLNDICHSSKLNALKQLLNDCGIGISDENQQLQQKTIELESIVNQHRALVFCQLKSMVEIIENDLFKKHLPKITYLRLDGSVPTNQRQSIVSRFNNDPSIDVLLLTTHIGGLGLNLTGADTVIFVEHDWNPTRDLQAMDRAHRIGQKKVVNVYRLITKQTLEEKIMGLQKFKTMVSNTVINQDNSGLGTMNVDQLLDLFERNSGGVTSNEGDERGQRGNTGRKSSVTELLPDLWDQQQYETEYDLSNFVSSLKN